MYQIDFTKPTHVHFIGIGGISMSGLAEILNKEGFTVTGSDVRESDVTRMLAEKGILVRSCANYRGLTSGDVRIAVRTHEENEQLIAALREIYGHA